jgi:hypothetical protein
MSLLSPFAPAELPEFERLTVIFDSLAKFPRLTDMQRALIFEAYDAAPDAGDTYDFRAQYAERWRLAKLISLGSTANHMPITLDRASGRCPDPTPEDIVTALHNAKAMGA